MGSEPIDPDAEYTVATSECLHYTTHEFLTLRGQRRTGEVDSRFERLVDDARAARDPEMEGRIERADGAQTAWMYATRHSTTPFTTSVRRAIK